jgi:hypothetical protein
MTRRTSLRAQARAIYRERTPKNASAAPRPKLTRLTARVRRLYEDSAVPVREIASLAGVSERTIYKYAARHGWKPRYAWARDRGWRARPKFAGVKGAGGRFIRRDDKGKPYRQGLKATDRHGERRGRKPKRSGTSRNACAPSKRRTARSKSSTAIGSGAPRSGAGGRRRTTAGSSGRTCSARRWRRRAGGRCWRRRVAARATDVASERLEDFIMRWPVKWPKGARRKPGRRCAKERVTRQRLPVDGLRYRCGQNSQRVCAGTFA